MSGGALAGLDSLLATVQMRLQEVVATERTRYESSVEQTLAKLK